MRTRRRSIKPIYGSTILLVVTVCSANQSLSDAQAVTRKDHRDGQIYMNTGGEALTEEAIRHLLQVFTNEEQPSNDKVFLGEDDLLFAIDESIFRRIHANPQDSSKLGPDEVAMALDAYLELSIDLCWRLSQTESKLQETATIAAELGSTPFPDPDCGRTIDGQHLFNSANEDASHLPPVQPGSKENVRSLCDLLKRIQKMLKAYIRITQEQSRKLSEVSRYLIHDTSPQLLPVAPLIA